MKVLFSPVGKRDPINFRKKDLTSNIDLSFTEASLLQTIREVKPDVIYLYMSKEIVELDEKDDRYATSVKEL